MKIGIDCRLSGSKHAGIGRYTKNLIINLIKSDSKIDWHLFFYDGDQVEDVLGELVSKKNVKIILCPVKHYSLEEQVRMPKIFGKEKLDLLHVPHFNIPVFYKGKIVITIHDLLWHEYKGGNVTTLSPVKYYLKYFFYRLVTKMAVNKAAKIIVPAETIKKTVTKFYPKVENKINITKEGGRIWNKKIKKVKKLDKTLLYVGSLYPHKNIKLVLRSLSTLNDYKLLVVGSRSVFRKRIETFARYNQIEEQIEMMGYIDDEKLAELYSSVSALVQPSFSEGFGLTGVEAMSLGTPILASDIPIFKEIYQDIAYYFSPHSESSFINAVHNLEKDDKKRLKKGIELAKKYDWGKMASETLAIYKNALK